MATLKSTKVRLVRCPRCREVLAELPDVTLYKCGGCGTILQAKIRKLETNHTELSSQETGSVAESQQDNVLEAKEARSSDHDLSSPPESESLPDKDNLRCQDEHGDCGMELCEERSVSEGLSSSPEVTCSGIEDSPVEVEESWEHDNALGQSSKRYYSGIHDNNGEWSGDRNFSNDFSSSGELTHEAEEYASEESEHVEKQNQIHLDQDNKVDQMGGDESEESVLPPDGENRDGIKRNHVQARNDENKNEDFHGGIKHAGIDASSEIASHENGNIQPAGRSKEVDDDGVEALPVFINSSTEKNNKHASVDDSIVASQSPLNESLVSVYLTSPDDKHLDHPPREVNRNFGRVSSVDTMRSSELNFKHQSMSKYPTSGSYYAYDGSESSYDGTDDHICEHISHPLRKGRDIKDGLRVNKVMNTEPEMDYWEPSSSHRATKSSHWSQDRPTRYTTGNRMRLDKQEGVSRLPFTSGDPVAGHRTVNSSTYQHGSLPPRPGLNKPSYLEADKMDLLRTVCELKDQLNRMHFPKAMPNRMIPSGVLDGKFNPFHYDHLAPEREIYADHPSGYNFSRMAFSGEAAYCRHQVSCSCLHCYPQEWHYSAAQLPSRCTHCKNGHRGVHSDHTCRNTSGSSSPQHYTGRDEIKRLHLREKYHKAKRLLRPITGGAPVVACYHCWELLQLPADFLLFKKRYHQLMCNACRKVLKFSLRKGTHLVPYLPSASAPPPSEADDYNGDTTGRRNLDRRSRCSSCQNVEPVSYSDDYGRSFCRSCSTEGEASFQKNPYSRKMSSCSSHEPVEDRKMKSVLREPENKDERLLKNVESVRSSTKMPNWRKVTSEIEELPPSSSNSPLHRLMGYSSPSQVFK